MSLTSLLVDAFCQLSEVCQARFFRKCPLAYITAWDEPKSRRWPDCGEKQKKKRERPELNFPQSRSCLTFFSIVVRKQI
ncbi:hypothetical protein BCV70DRAFT_123309 [Testicularia cyperi]|uniref:Uncharacterized protein n=1 Tax=Testicularia cyperi TaxID=1882483 RepID=A0A317XLW4_9BASI|nr:hypothetical protein BCV70DRAFT_123309 [Testicularia cyperi]